MMRIVGLFGSGVLASVVALAVPALAFAQSVAPIEMGQMVWMEVRDAVKAGRNRVIVPTGGIEQNGPHMTLDKHDHIVRFAAREIATRLGDTLVAPVMPYTPQGDIERRTGNLAFPGTFGVTEAAFDSILDGIARSLRNSGFRTIIFIGDNGANQAVQARVADRLSREWQREGVRVLHIEAYYDDRGQIEALTKDGIPKSAIGSHAGMLDTSELMAIAPDRVRLDNLAGHKGSLEPLGASGEPQRSTAELGRRLIEMRISAAVAAIRKQLAL